MTQKKVVTPHAYKRLQKVHRECCQKVEEIVAKVRQERCSWGIIKRETLLSEYMEARFWRNEYRRRLENVIPVKGSAWSPAAQERLARSGRLKRDDQ